MLAVEVKGMDYPRGKENNPVLPVFKIFEPHTKLRERIETLLVPDQISWMDRVSIIEDFFLSSHFSERQRPRSVIEYYLLVNIAVS
jgi:hypothetical protein